MFQGGFGEEKLRMKNLNFFYLFIQLIKTVQRGWLWWECLQYARTNCFNCNDWRYERVFSSWSSISIVSSQMYCEIFAIIFLIFVGEELTVIGFVRGEYEKNFENHWFRVFGGPQKMKLWTGDREMEKLEKHWFNDLWKLIWVDSTLGRVGKYT